MSQEKGQIQKSFVNLIFYFTVKRVRGGRSSVKKGGKRGNRGTITKLKRQIKKYFVFLLC